MRNAPNIDTSGVEEDETTDEGGDIDDNDELAGEDKVEVPRSILKDSSSRNKEKGKGKARRVRWSDPIDDSDGYTTESRKERRRESVGRRAKRKRKSSADSDYDDTGTDVFAADPVHSGPAKRRRQRKQPAEDVTVSGGQPDKQVSKTAKTQNRSITNEIQYEMDGNICVLKQPRNLRDASWKVLLAAGIPGCNAKTWTEATVGSNMDETRIVNAADAAEYQKFSLNFVQTHIAPLDQTWSDVSAESKNAYYLFVSLQQSILHTYECRYIADGRFQAF